MYGFLQSFRTKLSVNSFEQFYLIFEVPLIWMIFNIFPWSDFDWT